MFKAPVPTFRSSLALDAKWPPKTVQYRHWSIHRRGHFASSAREDRNLDKPPESTAFGTKHSRPTLELRTSTIFTDENTSSLLVGVALPGVALHPVRRPEEENCHQQHCRQNATHFVCDLVWLANPCNSI